MSRARGGRRGRKGSGDGGGADGRLFEWRFCLVLDFLLHCDLPSDLFLDWNLAVIPILAVNLIFAINLSSVPDERCWRTDSYNIA